MWPEQIKWGTKSTFVWNNEAFFYKTFAFGCFFMLVSDRLSSMLVYISFIRRFIFEAQLPCKSHLLCHLMLKNNSKRMQKKSPLTSITEFSSLYLHFFFFIFFFHHVVYKWWQQFVNDAQWLHWSVMTELPCFLQGLGKNKSFKKKNVFPVMVGLWKLETKCGTLSLNVGHGRRDKNAVQLDTWPGISP